MNESNHNECLSYIITKIIIFLFFLLFDNQRFESRSPKPIPWSDEQTCDCRIDDIRIQSHISFHFLGRNSSLSYIQSLNIGIHMPFEVYLSRRFRKQDFPLGLLLPLWSCFIPFDLCYSFPHEMEMNLVCQDVPRSLHQRI